MLTNPRPNLFESSEGFSVEVLGQTGLRYSERERKMFIDSEILAGKAGLVIYQDTIIRWEPPFEVETISENKRKRILENLKDVFRSQGFELQII